MKRDQLKELGLNEDQIMSVMDMNGDDINNAKDELIKENESLKGQLKDRDDAEFQAWANRIKGKFFMRRSINHINTQLPMLIHLVCGFLGTY